MRIVHSPKGATSWFLWMRNCDRCWKCTIQVEGQKKKVDNFNRVWWLRINPLTISPLIPSHLGSLSAPLITVVSPNRALLLCPSHIYGLNTCVSPPLDGYIEPLQRCDGNRRWGMVLVIRMRWGHEGGAPSMGLVSVDGIPRALASSLCSLSQETARCKLERALIRAQPCWHPQLTLPVEWWEINVCCL